MATKTDPIRWYVCRGRNGYDSPLAISRITPGQVAECLNVHLYGDCEMVTKRAGSSAVALTGDAHVGAQAHFRHVPGQDETAAEYFIVSADATTKILRVAGGAAKVNLTLMDNVADAVNTFAVTLNGKLFFPYDSTVNRLHVFDPNYSTTAVRRVGVGTPAAATVANTGGGAYPATLRYYRIAFTRQVGGVTKQRSLLSPNVSFTPSGAGTAARITKPASLSEGETHWEVYGSTDNALYYGPLTAAIAVGTTTYDDSSTPSTWATSFSLSPTEGANTPFPSVKFLATDGNRLVGFGFWELSAGDSLTPKAGQVVYSPVFDTSSIDDEERVSNTTTLIGTINISRNAGAEERGLVFFGDRFLAGFSRGIYALVPTGNDQTPFRRVGLTRRLGFVSQQSLVVGQDENGQEALYFLDPSDGPYRYSATNGFQWCGKDVKDLWDTANPAAQIKAWGLYFADLKQVWFGIATGANNIPDKILVLDVVTGRATASDGVRGGWTYYTGDLASNRCGAMIQKTLAATMSRQLVPYISNGISTAILKYDTTVTSDNGVAFQAYVDSYAFEIEPVFQNKGVVRSYVLGKAASGVTLQQSFIRNFGDETNRTDTAVMTAVGSETRLLKKFEASALVEAFTFQVRIGDASAVANGWTIDRWYARVDPAEDR